MLAGVTMHRLPQFVLMPLSITHVMILLTTKDSQITHKSAIFYILFFKLISVQIIYLLLLFSKYSNIKLIIFFLHISFSSSLHLIAFSFSHLPLPPPLLSFAFSFFFSSSTPFLPTSILAPSHLPSPPLPSLCSSLPGID